MSKTIYDIYRENLESIKFSSKDLNDKDINEIVNSVVYAIDTFCKNVKCYSKSALVINDKDKNFVAGIIFEISYKEKELKYKYTFNKSDVEEEICNTYILNQDALFMELFHKISYKKYGIGFVDNESTGISIAEMFKSIKEYVVNNSIGISIANLIIKEDLSVSGWYWIV